MPQNATQVFFFVNEFHDHLAAAPIGFTAANGNFEGVDAVQAQVDDGANADIGGYPDSNHVNNANMLDAGRRVAAAHADVPVRRAGSASSRTSTRTAATTRRSSTTSTPTACRTGSSPTRRAIPRCTGQQSGSMGEAWSDWYAFDYIVKGCTETTCNRPTAGTPTSVRTRTGSADLWLGQGVAGGPNRGVRTPADRLPGERRWRRLADHRREQRPGVPGRRQRPRRRLHLRRLRPDHRRTRGARRRRDLGRDAVADPPGDRARRATRSPRTS